MRSFRKKVEVEAASQKRVSPAFTKAAKKAARERLGQEPCPEISPDSLKTAIKRLSSGKVAGPDGIPNEALKIACDVLLPYLLALFNACVRLGYHPECFKSSYTVVLPKEGKDDYARPKSYRPIALLSCIGKVLERLMADRLQALAVEYGLVPPTQFGFAGRNCTKALEVIVNEVLNGWCAKTSDVKWRTTLMGLDISGAYDHVKRCELIKIFFDKGMPLWAIRFVWSFLSDRRTYIVIPGYTSAIFWVNVGIPQGSPISPILFAFFTGPMLEIFKKKYLSDDKTPYILQALSYVDDTYLVVTSREWEKNLRYLEQWHQKLIDWATPRGILFDPSKYSIMHFRKPRDGTAFTQVPDIPNLTLDNLILESAEDGLRVLGVKLDHALSWKCHIDHIVKKVNAKLGWLRGMSRSTWGPGLMQMRQLYITSIRPIITNACPVWFTNEINQELINRLDSLQCLCLRAIAGAFKSTSGPQLQKELHIQPIAVHLQRLASCHRARNIFTRDFELLDNHYFPHKQKLKFLESHSYRILYDRARGLVDDAEEALRQSDDKLKDVPFDDMDPYRRSGFITKHIRSQAELLADETWQEHCKTSATRKHAPNGVCDRPVAAQGTWGKHNLKRFKGLSRAQGTILIQCRTGFIGLNTFLRPRTVCLLPLSHAFCLVANFSTAGGHKLVSLRSR